MKLTKLILTTLLILSLTACSSSYRALENLQVIETIGIDANETGTVLTIASGQNSGTALMSSEGASISSAIENLQEYSSREEMFYAHTKYAVIGEDGAKESVLPYIDYFERAVSLRFGTLLFVVRDGTAKDLMSTSFSDTTDITDILTAMERNVRESGHSHVFSSSDIARSTIENGSALVCAIRSAPTENIIYSNTSENVAIPAGFGVLKNGKLVGYLDEEESSGAVILLGEKSLGTIIIDSDRRYSVDTQVIDCEITPTFSGETLTEVEVKCALSGGITEISSALPKLTPENFTELEAELANIIADRIASAIDYTIIYNADFLGLSNKLRYNCPHFPQSLSLCDINIAVTAEIDRSFDVRVPNL